MENYIRTKLPPTDRVVFSTYGIGESGSRMPEETEYEIDRCVWVMAVRSEIRKPDEEWGRRARRMLVEAKTALIKLHIDQILRNAPKKFKITVLSASTVSVGPKIGPGGQIDKLRFSLQDVRENRTGVFDFFGAGRNFGAGTETLVITDAGEPFHFATKAGVVLEDFTGAAVLSGSSAGMGASVGKISLHFGELDLTLKDLPTGESFTFGASIAMSETPGEVEMVGVGVAAG